MSNLCVVHLKLKCCMSTVIEKLNKKFLINPYYFNVQLPLILNLNVFQEVDYFNFYLLFSFPLRELLNSP